MKMGSRDVLRRWWVRLLGSGLALALVLAAAGAAGFVPALADGGAPVLDTSTPTATATQVFLILPTDTPVPQLLLPATNTPVVEAGLPPYPLVSPQAPLLIVTPVEPGSPVGSQPLLCWAFPLALIIIIIIVASSLGFWRRYHPA
jgi:hypothetical protein